ncbi:hypothetical protein SK128_001809 [Halocaridina rubra]|uniref:NADP-dependent oxidoreductase domain-containing protein n=1 Tax=Halocaridina rubra TaxID=373956 RepID=A0AAN9A971_HALRR
MSASVPDIILPNGDKMPVIGIGTFLVKPEDIPTTITTALECGYRHIDTAYMYQNEEAIGQVLKKWCDKGEIKREELFIVTKLPSIANRASDVAKFLDKSLERLQLSYVDLFLIHLPVGMKGKHDDDVKPLDEDGNVVLDLDTDLVSLYKAMEEQVDRGKAKSIGLSNFSCEQIERILKVCRIKPANHQIEFHVYYQNKTMLEFCKQKDITVCAYAPLGAPYKPPKGKDTVPHLLEHPGVTELASRLNRTPSQILLRFLYQQDMAIIPKSTKAERIKENFQVFDFELSPDDMKTLESLDQGTHGILFNFKVFKGIEKHPEYPF